MYPRFLQPCFTHSSSFFTVSQSFSQTNKTHKHFSYQDGSEQQCDCVHKLRGRDPLNPDHRCRNLAIKRASRFLRSVSAMARHHPRSSHLGGGSRRLHRSLFQSHMAPRSVPRCHAGAGDTASVSCGVCLHGDASRSWQH